MAYVPLMDHLMYQFDVFLPNLITQTTGNYLVLLKPIIQMVEAASTTLFT